MKRIVQTLIFIALSSTMASADQEKITGYFQLDGGVAQFTDGEINDQDVTFDRGWSINGRAGGEIDRFALEIEAGVHGAKHSPATRDYNPTVFLTAGVNAIYKFLQLPGLDAYGSVGAGFIPGEVEGIQINAHAESGLILRLHQYVQLVPHIRTTAIWNLSEGEVKDVGNGSQYISTARLGIRYTLPTLKP